MKWSTIAAVGAVLAAAGAGTAAPAGEGEQRLTARDAPLSRAFYHAEITYEGSRVVLFSIRGAAGLRMDTETHTGRYEARTRRPVRLIAHCVGVQGLQLFPRELRGVRGHCPAIRRRALALLPDSRRKGFGKQFDKRAQESYEFGRSGRRIRLEGEVTAGSFVHTSHPIQVARRTSGGLVTVTCIPDAKEGVRLLRTTQEGLVITLESGAARPRRNASVGVRRTTFGGIDLSSSVEGGEGVAQARFDHKVTEHRCPGAGGSEETTIPGVDIKGGATTWQPLDRIITNDPEEFLDRKLRVRHFAPKLGREFPVVARLNPPRPMTGAGPGGIASVTDDHRWSIKFTPCPNPKSPKRCPAPEPD